MLNCPCINTHSHAMDARIILWWGFFTWPVWLSPSLFKFCGASYFLKIIIGYSLLAVKWFFAVRLLIFRFRVLLIVLIIVRFFIFDAISRLSELLDHNLLFWRLFAVKVFLTLIVDIVLLNVHRWRENFYLTGLGQQIFLHFTIMIIHLWWCKLFPKASTCPAPNYLSIF